MRVTRSMIQTKLGHERLARDEAVQCVESAMREVEQKLAAARQELEAERSQLTTTARERDQAILGRQAAEDPLRQAKDAPKVVRRAKSVAPPEHPAAAPQPRRHGRPPKVPRGRYGGRGMVDAGLEGQILVAGGRRPSSTVSPCG
jgi:hypothetical protein